MKPFLQSIAEAYLANESASELEKMIFIFPNKRAATFFNHHLENAHRNDRRNTALLHPAAMSIVEFAETYAEGIAPADRLEMAFMLYDIYREAVSRHAADATDGNPTAPSHPLTTDTPDFNSFVFWADTLLKDFDDVDNALADPDEIFHNVSTLKEISANYLTPEQIEEIRHYWQKANIQLGDEEQKFWNHIAYASENRGDDSRKGNAASPSLNFLKLWQVVGEVYREFRRRLLEKELYTPGMNFRHAAEVLADTGAESLPYSRYIFIGFNNLSRAERSIFTRLKDLRNPATGQSMADFYWDLSSPVFRLPDLPGISQVAKYAKEFPSLYGEYIERIDTFPQTFIVGVPSMVGQCQAIGKALSNLLPPAGNNQYADPDRLRGTAIVLPDEQMLTPLVNSLPPAVHPVNLTMGSKLRNSSVATLIRDIVSLQMRSYSSAERHTFFADDVYTVLTHPLVRGVNTATAASLIARIRDRRMFNVPEQFFQEVDSRGVFSPIFTMVSDRNSCSDVFEYLDRLLLWLDRSLSLTWGEGEEHSLGIQKAFLLRYKNALETLRHLKSTYLEAPDGTTKIELKDATVFNLVERVVAGEMLNFEGVPLEGLQVMGVLEARALDFDTVIIPSMNERIFPRAHFAPTFIPEVLRKTYGLITAEQQEGAFAYFFYRMIARASSVHLIYDARTTGTHAGGPSRFILQILQIIKPEHVSHTVLPYHLSDIKPLQLEVKKDRHALDRIARFFSDKCPDYLSPSSLEKLLSCPLAFYLEKIAGYKEGHDIRDYIDEGIMGDIVHDTLQAIYTGFMPNPNKETDIEVTSDMLYRVINNRNPLIEHLLTRSINRIYLLDTVSPDTPPHGEAEIIYEILRRQVRATLSHDIDLTPFIYKHSEYTIEKPLRVTDNNGESETFNFRGKIDRIDRVTERYKSGSEWCELDLVRIVDYKTGGDKVQAKNVADVFSGDYRTKAFVQLMLYCQAYADEIKDKYSGPIQPVIYPILQSMKADRNFGLLKWSKPAGTPLPPEDAKKPATSNGKWKVYDYRDYAGEFNEHLIRVLRELKDPDIPFKAAADDSACKFCKFIDMCRRTP
jgi:hypothetical protein